MSSVDAERRTPTSSASNAIGGPRDEVRPMTGGSIVWVPLVTLIVGVVITGTLALVSHTQYVNNEKRLLKLRVRDAAALVAGSLPAVQIPLASAAEVAGATNGNKAKFERFVSRYVGTGTGHPFRSVSLWRLSSVQTGPAAVLGFQPELSPTAAAPFFARAARLSSLTIANLLQSPNPRLGYAFAIPAPGGGYAVYAENPLPSNRHSRFQKSSQFADLDYALYLGSAEIPRNLLVSDLPNPPPHGTTDSEAIPFGDTTLLLVMSPRVPLAGSLPERLPLIIAIIGTLISIVAALGTRRLIQRRRDAERLAGRLEQTATENRRLYAEQRSIAQTLQHALLPDALPVLPGVQSSARYEAGEHGIDIGGDWYDVIALDERRLLLVVGDVSGRGLRAAATMASLRYAIHAYAAQNDPPEQILSKLTDLMNVAEGGQIATVLCAVIDVERHEITVSSAGHLPPLLITGGRGEYLRTEVGLPIGAEPGSSYISTTIPAPRAGTFVAFTDGLVEQRGESIDQGLKRLSDTATTGNGSLSELLARLVSELPSSEDDVAIVGLRWTS